VSGDLSVRHLTQRNRVANHPGVKQKSLNQVMKIKETNLLSKVEDHGWSHSRLDIAADGEVDITNCYQYR
jgi:hypothetical protein